MKFFTILCFAAAVPGLQATGNFKSTCNAASNQMNDLSRSIGLIKSTAKSLGHKDISSKCDEALSHLGYAQSSWQGISSGFVNSPWNARRSPHANIVKGRLSSCSVALIWIYGCPRFRHPRYRDPEWSCRNNYNGCQSSCQKIWNWPSPPRPSGGYGGGYYRREVQPISMCPSPETACRISNSTSSVECLDTQNDITSCGGCVSEGNGENCMDIIGADGVGCKRGKCDVLSVKEGYILNEEGRPEAVELF